MSPRKAHERSGYERRIAQQETAPTYDQARHGSVYADELADTREAERLKRERGKRP